jgi:hypothetical protein
MMAACFAALRGCEMKKPWPNDPAAGKAGIARLLTIEHHYPGLPELVR